MLERSPRIVAIDFLLLRQSDDNVRERNEEETYGKKFPQGRPVGRYRTRIGRRHHLSVYRDTTCISQSRTSQAYITTVR